VLRFAIDFDLRRGEVSKARGFLGSQSSLVECYWDGGLDQPAPKLIAPAERGLVKGHVGGANADSQVSRSSIHNEASHVSNSRGGAAGITLATVNDWHPAVRRIGW
jgi:hypothetical protein